MNISKYIIVIGAAIALASGSFFRVLEYLAANPIPTWLALSVLIPTLLFGLLAIAKGEIDCDEERAKQ